MADQHPPAAAAGAAGESARSRRKGRPRDDAADVRILTAAAELLLTRGYEQMTVDEVAARAGAGKATVYRRWSGKRELAVAALQRLYTTEMPLPDTGNIRDDLRELFGSALAFAASAEGHSHVRTMLGEAIGDGGLGTLYASVLQAQHEAAEALFRRAIERGEVRADLPMEFAVSWISGFLVLAAATDRPPPGIEQVDRMVDLLIDGIGNR